jgi:molecular chaperone GrpE
MSTEHEPEDTTQAAGAGADASAPAGAESAADESSPRADASAAAAAPEGAVAVEEHPQAAEPEVDPLEGKSDAEIRELAAQAAEYLALAQRTRADFDNYRKRAQRDLAAARQRGGVELTRELLPAIDNAERALEHETSVVFDAGEDGQHARRILDALKTIHGELVAALGRGGIERFDPLGEPFDPNRHEAMAKRPADGGEDSGICGPIFQPGYAAGDEIVRPARVIVTE